MTDQDEELHELKKLMQDLFINDLIQEAAKVRDGIAVDWGAALNRFKHKFDETYSENYSVVNKPDIEDLIKKIANVSGENMNTQSKLDAIKIKSEKIVQTSEANVLVIKENINNHFSQLNKNLEIILNHESKILKIIQTFLYFAGAAILLLILIGIKILFVL